MSPWVTLSRLRPALLQDGQGLANGVRGSLLLLGNRGLFPGFRLTRHQKRGNRTLGTPSPVPAQAEGAVPTVSSPSGSGGTGIRDRTAPGPGQDSASPSRTRVGIPSALGIHVPPTRSEPGTQLSHRCWMMGTKGQWNTPSLQYDLSPVPAGATRCTLLPWG